MPPATLVRKVMAYELAESKKNKRKKIRKKAEYPSSSRKRASAAEQIKTTKSMTSTSVSSSSERILSIGAKSYRIQFEYSPHGRNKCPSCDQRIRKDALRIGVLTSGRKRRRFYHAQCLPEELRKVLPQHFNLRPTLEGEQQLSAMMVQRGPMQRSPATSAISGRANKSPEVIVIDDSEDECDSRNISHGENSVSETLEDNRVIENDCDCDDNNDDEIQVEETYTCAQVVQQKFDRAAANGEIVVID